MYHASPSTVHPALADALAAPHVQACSASGAHAARTARTATHAPVQPFAVQQTSTQRLAQRLAQVSAKRRVWLAGVLGQMALMAGLVMGLQPAHAQVTAKAAGAPATAASNVAWPTRTIKLVVGFPAGSSPDITARMLADPLSAALGQPVIVENKAGAGGNIGAAAVAQATDGHTLGLMINGNLTTAKVLNPATPYDPLKDLAPVSLVATAPLVLVAPANVLAQTNPGTPVAAAAVFKAGAQAGGNWNYGTPGIGTVAHLGMELLKRQAGLAAVHVPYPGNPQVITGMLGGQTQLALLPPGLAMPQVRSGKLVALGITSTGRSTLVPEVPALAESGVPGLKDFQLEIWNAVAAPATMPAAHIQRVATALADIVRTPEMRQKLFNQGWQVAGTSPEALALRIKLDAARMGGVIRAQGIQAQ